MRHASVSRAESTSVGKTSMPYRDLCFDLNVQHLGLRRGLVLDSTPYGFGHSVHHTVHGFEELGVPLLQATPGLKARSVTPWVRRTPTSCLARRLWSILRTAGAMLPLAFFPAVRHRKVSSEGFAFGEPERRSSRSPPARERRAGGTRAARAIDAERRPTQVCFSRALHASRWHELWSFSRPSACLLACLLAGLLACPQSDLEPASCSCGARQRDIFSRGRSDLRHGRPASAMVPMSRIPSGFVRLSRDPQHRPDFCESRHKLSVQLRAQNDPRFGHRLPLGRAPPPPR